MTPLAAIALALLSGLTAAAEMSQQEKEDWFNGKSASAVNEGALAFLTSLPEKPVHHHQNRIRITPESLASGWIELEQCHDHLDAVPAMQITFREGYVRELKVVETRHIERAWVEGSSIQLAGVAPGARLCLSAQTRALNDSGGGYYTLNNGPYMRKFLDGYYPMRVALRIEYPAELLRVIDISPQPQPGLDISQQAGNIALDAAFEGELRTQVQFERGPWEPQLPRM